MIAIIEDDDAMYALMQKLILNDIQHKRFVSISDFTLSKKDFKCALIDLSLPDSWGVDTIFSVREIFSGVIIVLTGVAGDYLHGKHYKMMMDAGAKDVFTKDKISDPDYCQMLRKVILDECD